MSEEKEIMWTKRAPFEEIIEQSREAVREHQHFEAEETIVDVQTASLLTQAWDTFGEDIKERLTALYEFKGLPAVARVLWKATKS